MFKKVYLIDTENVKSEWKILLDKGTKKDRLLIFYTENSPNVSFADFSNLVKYPVKYEMIPCYLGKNGLDFQLVSFLGYLLRKNPFREYVIVSNDTGFDTVVYFWAAKGKKVNRISTNELHNLKMENKPSVGDLKSAEIVEPKKVNVSPKVKKTNHQKKTQTTEVKATKTGKISKKINSTTSEHAQKKKTPEKIQQDATLRIKEVLGMQKGIDFSFLFALIREQGPDNMQLIYQTMVKKWGQEEATVLYNKLKPEIRNIYNMIKE